MTAMGRQPVGTSGGISKVTALNGGGGSSCSGGSGSGGGGGGDEQ
jgi:hypothetical protein